MTKIILIFLLFFSTSVLGQTSTTKVSKDKKQIESGQKNFKIQGRWECYSSISDTTKPDDVQVWYFFDNSKMTVLSGLDIVYHKLSGGTEKYQFKNDTLKLLSKDKTVKIKMTVHTNNFISYVLPDDDESNRVYLRRVRNK